MSSSNANVNLISADDFNAELPDIDSFQTFELKRKSNLSGQELYALFDETVEKYFPKLFSNEEKDLIYDINGTDNNGNFLEGNFNDNKDKISNYYYQHVYNYFLKNELDAGHIDDSRDILYEVMQRIPELFNNDMLSNEYRKKIYKILPIDEIKKRDEERATFKGRKKLIFYIRKDY